MERASPRNVSEKTLKRISIRQLDKALFKIILQYSIKQNKKKKSWEIAKLHNENDVSIYLRIY